MEYKFNLTPGTGIWVAAMELLKALRHGVLDGCQPEYRNEFQIYFTENHLFDLHPDGERRPRAEAEVVYGGHLRAPRADLPRPGHFPGRLRGVLREEMGLQVRAMPPFRRVRYDIQCESMITGHICGIFLDHCSLLAAPDVRLSQCELEYRRSRSLLDHDQNEVLAEMERIRNWLQDYLTARPDAGAHLLLQAHLPPRRTRRPA
ncbi:hypothetical protein [Nonomuraea sp. NPDC049028]|uniref:hypothetical protein n=1 Tax=Nonomuraea sp. NPDC049028 TaxID=3364348 RepID=UPI0037202DD3